MSVRARPQAWPRLPTPSFGAAGDATAASSAPGPPAPPRPQPWASLRPAPLGLRAGPWGRWRFGCCSRHFAGWPSLTVGRGAGGGGQDPGCCGLRRSADFESGPPGREQKRLPHLPPNASMVVFFLTSDCKAQTCFRCLWVGGGSGRDRESGSPRLVCRTPKSTYFPPLACVFRERLALHILGDASGAVLRRLSKTY